MIDRPISGAGYGALLGCGCIAHLDKHPEGYFVKELVVRPTGHGHGPNWYRGVVITKDHEAWPLGILRFEALKEKA